MEPHELAIAALQEVAQSGTSHQKHAGSATNNNIDSAAGEHPLPQPVLGIHAIMSRPDAARGEQGNSAPNDQSSHNSQSADDDNLVFSPPASEGFSSQSTNPDGLSQLSQLSQLAAAQRPLISTSTSPKLTIASTAGQKRTADGQVKATSSISPTSPHKRGHSRNTSTTSNVSSVASIRIGELSSELRTRLSYAMVKVNNGWTSNTIDEVESLASQKGSPTSSSSTLQGRRNQFASPRTAIADVQQADVIPSTQSSTSDFDLYTRTGQPSRTYESFWRDHSATSFPSNKQSFTSQSTSSPPSKSLAPPADIRPTPSSRRSDTPKFSKPPMISRPQTPPYWEAPGSPARMAWLANNKSAQTPTQKTIQEQDAIESLLFMSSPGNSGNMRHTFPAQTHASPQASPLRAEFGLQARGAQGRRVEFDAAAGGSTGSSEAGGTQYRSKIRGSAATRDKARADAMDQMLDEMGSSSDEELDLRPISRGYYGKYIGTT